MATRDIINKHLIAIHRFDSYSIRFHDKSAVTKTKIHCASHRFFCHAAICFKKKGIPRRHNQNERQMCDPLISQQEGESWHGRSIEFTVNSLIGDSIQSNHKDMNIEDTGMVCKNMSRGKCQTKKRFFHFIWTSSSCGQRRKYSTSALLLTKK